MTTKTTLLAASILLCLHAGNGLAAELAPNTPDASAADAGAATGTADAARDATTLDVVSVVGTGQTRQVQALGKADLQREAAGTSPLKVMAKLPGVHFQSSDPWGNYEWSSKLSIRGFSQQQLGFTLDGVPLGDMSYGNHNGLHISRAITAENLSGAELSQGSGAIDTASSGNLGGTLRFFSADPSADFGVRLAQTIGSDSTSRSYVRMDTGDHNGFSAYLSGVFHTTDKWKGEGPQRNTQFNGKFIYAGDDFKITGYADSSRRRETDYADLSLESAKRLGMDWDNYAKDWQRAIDAANGIFRGGVTSLDDAYYIARGVRDDDLAYLSGEWNVNPDLTLAATIYYHNNEGQGHWATPYSKSPTVPIRMRTTEYDIERTGFMPSLSWQIGNHRLQAGLWLEKNDHGVQRNFYDLSATEPPDDIFFYRNPSQRVFRQRFDTDTRMYYVLDHMEFIDGRLAIDAGFKGLKVETDGKTLIGGASRASGKLVSEDNFLPQLGARWQLSEHEEIFGSYSENLSAFRTGVNGPHSTSQAAFDAAVKTLEPESSKTLEAGLRTSRDQIEASVAVYRVNFENRLLAIARCAGIVGCASSFANVGDVESRGAEVTVLWKPIAGLSWYNSLAFNDSQYESDYLDGTTLVRTKGKQVVDAPKRLYATEIRWEQGGLSLQLGAKYTDKRYLTYLNDSKVSGFWVVDASASYEWKDVSWADSFKLQLNMTNLFDKEYFGSIGTNGFVASDPRGLNYTVQSGAPRQAFLTAEVRF
ncbi:MULTISPECIES: TonB-dependent receptor [unclassified Lysobacter]|uniref:TonB-dependent receptor n=1 Tax=unclassified Lysobacter TaxID=2635362 RepID=UPI001BE6B5A1|nr:MULTISPECIES: TonB-dependent receptor [unclassified Lysobacter]MBT2747101.1 TonB-dependent receptor [Lysobacter sp. ISL-42]MBT2750438.1 TonB-dependent receptor [Lysobacter sp. ISL-50]MBT2776284.1 TonB-dependent receptor [Lysobacter sp. ISL-54]MBT2780779.1 TonB-dependent receptor [Lysobacter sp. ISL-52]